MTDLAISSIHTPTRTTAPTANVDKVIIDLYNRRITTYLDGSKFIEFPNNTTRKVNKLGTSISTADGRTSIIYLDGTCSFYERDGSYNTKKPDGKRYLIDSIGNY